MGNLNGLDPQRGREFLERVIDERDRIYADRFEGLKTLIDERDRQYESRFRAVDAGVDSRFKSGEVAVNAALAAQEKAVNAAFTASEKAIVKAEQAQKEYNERSNEFRGQLDDQAKTLMPRPETLNMFKSLEEKLAVFALSSKNDLGTHRAALDKSIDALGKDIIDLREFRSSAFGQSSTSKIMHEQKQWAIGIGIAIALGMLSFVGSIMALVLQYARGR